METRAIVINAPKRISVDCLTLSDPAPGDLVVQVEHSGISTGTERLLWSGDMPPFPGMGYPLVPGYESVGRVVDGPAGRIGETVFVPGATCFGPVRGLFGASASLLVVPAGRAVPVSEALGARAILLALAATAFHAGSGQGE